MNCSWSRLAFFRAFFPGLSGMSIVGVLMFALAVIRISLEGNENTKPKSIKVAKRRKRLREQYCVGSAEAVAKE